ncbi:hypothetical protein NDU88_001135 [Pleurodeles waltl]|uniref:Uncharacterized protein n=1 Tax=Pleurodeles waltl TaxID=8319 RepID=A0AAV7U5N3_PLEWA|nr:hypothetical protein NDU88_001135 [Pleurodeles waltl]
MPSLRRYWWLRSARVIEGGREAVPGRKWCPLVPMGKELFWLRCSGAGLCGEEVALFLDRVLLRLLTETSPSPQTFSLTTTRCDLFRKSAREPITIQSTSCLPTPQQ